MNRGYNAVDGSLNKFYAMQEPVGYPIDPSTGLIDRDSSVITWDNGTRTLSIDPTGDYFDYWVGGIQKRSTGESIQITDTEGIWFFYFDDDGFKTTQIFNLNIIYNSAFTAFLYWDAVNQEAIGPFDERHGAKMDGHTHGIIHEKFGTRHESGGLLTDIDADSSGDDDTSAQFGISDSLINDEDIDFPLDAILSTEGLPILYLEGFTPVLRKSVNAGFSILTGSNGRMVFNENDGGTWQLTEIGSNDYGLCHIFLTSGIGKKGQAFAVVGQGDYGTLGQARTAAPIEIKELISVLPVQEKDWIATVILQTVTSYNNAVKSRIRTNDIGTDWLDWRYWDYKDFIKDAN